MYFDKWPLIKTPKYLDQEKSENYKHIDRNQRMGMIDPICCLHQIHILFEK